MHRSRLAGYVIDCRVDELDAATLFWSRALGKPALPPDPEDPAYRELATRADEPKLLLQRVDHPSRIHLDIESDDIDAEASRLESLGAKRVGFVKRWWVMEAPSGQRFCVVRARRGPLGEGANEWK